MLWGVMRINCRPAARRAACIIMRMLTSRLTLSMKTSLLKVNRHNEIEEIDLQLIQAANWRAHCLPEREEETYGGERLLTSRQRLGLPSLVGLARDVWLHLWDWLISKVSYIPCILTWMSSCLCSWLM
jgi:hypothetical protein